MTGKPGSGLIANSTSSRSSTDNGEDDKEPLVTFSPGNGVPMCWVKRVVAGRVTTRALPSSGLIENVLIGAAAVKEDSRVEACRRANPCPKAL